LLVSAAPFLDSQGGYRGAFAMLNDISERKQVEEALNESNLLLEKTFTSLKESIFIVETGSRIILDCNEACEEMFGYARNEMIGSQADLFHVSKEMSKSFGRGMLQGYAEKGYYETVSVLKRKDGTIFDCEHSVTPIRNDKGEITRHVCVVRDISEQMRMQKELEARNTFVESIFAHLKSGIVVVDRENRIKMLNRHAAEFSGELPEVFIGRELSEICPELHEALVSGLSSGEIPVTLFERTRVIGFTKFDLDSSYLDSAGCIINFKDLTEDIKIRKILRHKERLSAMGEVVASVAHEMRNPLFAISSVAQILEMELSLDPAQKELMESLLKESRRINDLVEELLDSTRELRIKRSKVELNAIVAETFLVLKTVSEDKRVPLRNSSFAEKIMVHADSQKLEQVLINLVKNAIEASSADSPVELTIGEEEGEVVISVTDGGEGIDSDVIEKIFDVFFTTKRGGTGLGLSISRNIIEAHDGTLTAVNNPGAGATFTVRLPFTGDNQ
jgi:PAS domain S-box-containing protein